MSNLVNKWEHLKRERVNAEEWNDLPNGTKYRNDTFNISTAHCSTPKLTRAGQQIAGAQNYWETSKEFSLAILEYIVDGWEDHYPSILEILKSKESDALLACQEYVDNMQEQINGVKVNKKP